jgi:hypothetical protein
MYTGRNIIFLHIILISTVIPTKEGGSSKLELHNKIIDHYGPYDVANKHPSMLRGVGNSNGDIFDSQNQAIQHNICNSDSCEAPNYCLNNKVCKCTGDFITYNLNKENINIFCNYKKKRQLTAILLEIIIPIGFGHFYSGRVLCGLLKLLIFSILSLYAFKVLYSGLPNIAVLKTASFEQISHYLLAIMIILGIVIWHFFDLYMFFTNKYYDGNGVTLVAFYKN